MSLRSSKFAWAALAGAVSFIPLAQAGSAPDFSGEILGEVHSSNGVAQMGATVLLFNRYDQLIKQTLSNEQGRFAFGMLAPDTYSIRVSLASFVPAMRRNIAVAAGSEAVLKISLASLLSTIEVLPASATAGTLISDDWKWVLRSSPATRPVLRLLPEAAAKSSSSRASAMFTNATSVVKLSAGDGDPFSAAVQKDLGTGFGIAASINGTGNVRVSGNFGTAPITGSVPSAALRASYAPNSENGVQFVLTARQVYLPSLAGSGPGNMPALRTASLAALDRMQVMDNLWVDYGVSLDSISFLNRMNYANVFGRASYELGDGAGAVRVAYVSAAQPETLIARQGDAATDLNQDLTMLNRLPRVSLEDGRLSVQRNQDMEAGYELVRGSRTYSASVYREEISNAAFLLSGEGDMVSMGNLLPDLDSRGVVFNAGNLNRTGVTVGVTQALGQHAEVALAAGRGEALVAAASEAASLRGDDLRALIHSAPRGWLTARVSGTIPVSGTHLGTSYGWTDFRALTPAHYSLTSNISQEIGWNVQVRQPLPAVGGVRVEASAELRNLMAQGYLPIATGTRRAILTNSPRGVRGGLSFIF
jgi:hypothetical protein